MSWLRDWLHSETDGALRVLAIMRDRANGAALQEAAARARWHLDILPDLASALERLRQHRADIILYDRNLPGSDWPEAIGKLAVNAPGSCILLASPVKDDHLWHEVIQRGGYDVLTLPLQEERVIRTVQLASAFCARK